MEWNEGAIGCCPAQGPVKARLERLKRAAGYAAAVLAVVDIQGVLSFSLTGSEADTPSSDYYQDMPTLLGCYFADR